MKEDKESKTNGRHPVRNTGAAFVGAVQGLKEGLQEENLVDESVRTIHNIGELTRAVRRGGREEWESPEIRQLRGQMRRGTDTAMTKTRDMTSDATSKVRDRQQQLTNQVKETTHDIQETTGHIAREGRHRIQAVATTTRRARRAPRQIKEELVAAKDSYKDSLKASLGMYAVLAVFGTAAFVLFTGGLVVTLNLLLGVPAGWFVTLGLYALVGVGAYMFGRRYPNEKREEAREHVQDARREARHVTQPVREAFTHNTEVRT